jgi:hypothetical protein
MCASRIHKVASGAGPRACGICMCLCTRNIARRRRLFLSIDITPWCLAHPSSLLEKTNINQAKTHSPNVLVQLDVFFPSPLSFFLSHAAGMCAHVSVFWGDFLWGVGEKMMCVLWWTRPGCDGHAHSLWSTGTRREVSRGPLPPTGSCC